jgi:hypothetical protein
MRGPEPENAVVERREACVSLLLLAKAQDTLRTKRIQVAQTAYTCLRAQVRIIRLRLAALRSPSS